MRTSFVLFASGLAVAMAQDMTMSALPMPVQQISDGQVQNPAPLTVSAVGGMAAPVGSSAEVTMASAAATGGLVVATPEGTPVPTFTMLVGSAAANGSSGTGSNGAAGSQVTSIAGASSSPNLLGAAGATTSSTGVAQVSTAGAAPMATAAGLGFVGLVAALAI